MTDSSLGYDGVLLDIEGTTSSISFVFDVMFPYVRTHLREYLDANAGEPACVDACDQIAKDAGHADFANGFGGAVSDQEARNRLADHVIDLMDRDVKATGLKQLQGLIWQAGFESGEMSAHVYPDVVPALRRWKEAGIRIWIYSSGSIHAQKLFFGHSEQGDLLEMFDGHWDTTVGNKKEADSYRAIAGQIESSSGVESSRVLFISDVPAELDAASAAGMQTRLSIRPGNKPVPDDCIHERIDTFSSV